MVRFLIKVCQLLSRFSRVENGCYTWTKQDCLNLQVFLTSDTGKNFLSTMRHYSKELNDWAVNNGDTRSCGIASGFKQAITTMDALKKFSDEEGTRGTSFVERIIP